MSFDDADLGICFNIFFAREVTDFPSWRDYAFDGSEGAWGGAKVQAP